MNRRVLIVNSQSIYFNNATGITLRSIFEKMNTSSLMEVYWMDDKEEHKIKNIKLGYRKYSFAAFLIKKRNNKINNAIKRKTSSNKHTKETITTYIRQYLALIPDRSKLVIRKNEMKKIKMFSPDVIYTLGGSLNALRMAYELSTEFNIPIIVHHMDNWMHCIQWENNPFLNNYKKRLREMCKKCYTRSNISLTISEEMANDFSKEYGVKHVAIMNCVNVKEYECGENNNSVFRFTYAGGLHLDRYRALIDIANVIEKYNDKNSQKAELVIYTGEDNIRMFGSMFDDYLSTKIYKAVPHERIKEVYQDADALIHVESKSLEENDFFKYSVSTKIPEYLSTGRPVLYYGPDSICLYRLLNNNKVAFVASDMETINNQINQIIKNKLLVNVITSNAKSYSCNNYDSSIAIKKMKKAIEKSTNG